MLDGEGVVVEGDAEHAIKAGDVILVCPEEVHQFRNPSARTLKFLCLVPNSALQQPTTSQPECQAITPCGME